jgi:Carboxypeptidase regulatory-like domain
MNATFIRSRYSLVASAALFAALACARKPEASLDPMLAAPVCDTTPMKPLGRVVRIPAVVPSANLGTLTGVVIQRETGDALPGAGIMLVPAVGTSGRSYRERYTNEQGGFTFDSIAPGRYQIRVRRIIEYRDSASFEAVSGRVDTVRIPMRAYRCHGY